MKTVLITGANRGIGLAITEGMKDLEYNVLLSGRDETSVKEAAETIGATPVVLDVADKENIAEVAKGLGPVDVLINNAGVLGEGGVLDDPAEWERSMKIMVDGPFYLMHYLVPGMIEHGYGRVVNMSSGWGSFEGGLGGPGAYGVAKAALNALTFSASRTTPNTVKINSMCPGWVRTDMGGQSAPRSPKQGAETAIYLATLPDDGPTGSFFRDKQPIPW